MVANRQQLQAPHAQMWPCGMGPASQLAKRNRAQLLSLDLGLFELIGSFQRSVRCYHCFIGYGRHTPLIYFNFERPSSVKRLAPLGSYSCYSQFYTYSNHQVVEICKSMYSHNKLHLG